MKQYNEFKNGGLGFLLAALVPTIFVFIFQLAVLVPIALSLKLPIIELAMSDYVLAITMFLTQLTMILTVLFVCRKHKNVKSECRLHAVKNKKVYFFAFVLSMGLIFGLAFVNDVFLTFLNNVFGYEPQQLTIMKMDTLPKYLVSVLVICVMPAIGEELVFRGLVFNAFKKFGSEAAVLCSAALFSIMHANPMQTLYQFIVGAIFAFVVLKTGSILPAMLMHFLNNFTVSTVEYFKLFGDLQQMPLPIIVFGIVILMIGLVYFCRIKNESNSVNSVETQDFFITKNEEMVLSSAGIVINSEDELFNKRLDAVRRVRNKGDIMTGIIYFGIGVAYCLIIWSMSFSAGL